MKATMIAILLIATGTAMAELVATETSTTAPPLAVNTTGFDTTQPTATQPTTVASGTTEPVTTAPTTMEAATEPASRPVHIAAGSKIPHADSVPSMKRDYSVLLTRSIFIKGRQITSDSSAYDSNRSGSVSATASSTQEASTPESNLVFNGVTVEGDRADALVENLSERSVATLKVGDAVARGTIVAITLNSLDYQAAGRTMRIGIGQTLAGGDYAGASSQPSASSGSAPVPVSGSGGDVLERMRRRRLQELGVTIPAPTSAPVK